MAQPGPCWGSWGGEQSTHGRAWLHGGGSRKGCQHVASLQRETKPSEFGPCQPIPQLCHQLWEQHIPVRATQGRCGDGPWEDMAVDGESGHRFGAGGEKERKESSGQSRVRKRPLGEEGFSFWSLLELQDRKRRSTLGVSWAGQTNRPHRPQTPLWKTCKETLQGAQGQRGARDTQPGLTVSVCQKVSTMGHLSSPTTR